MLSCVGLATQCWSGAAHAEGDYAAEFTRLFAIIATPNILFQPAVQLKRDVREVCWDSKRNEVERERYGNIECVAGTGVRYFDLWENAGAVDLIEVRFAGKQRIDHMIKAMTKRIGNPTEIENGSYNWSLRPTRTQPDTAFVMISFSAEENVTYLTMYKGSTFPD